jgi:hypothetical protein
MTFVLCDKIFLALFSRLERVPSSIPLLLTAGISLSLNICANSQKYKKINSINEEPAHFSTGLLTNIVDNYPRFPSAFPLSDLPGMFRKRD